MMLSAKDIRAKYLEYFEAKGHKIVPSAPLVIKNDPTLMFINAGMNPFKDIFLGNSEIKNPRIADTQKCLRVSGKHNDLDEVGYDTYHHTLFEMLGNWSFGDYFKEEAIEWAWDLLTNVFALSKDRLYVTVFEGDQKDGTAFDQEAYDFWKKWIPEDRIINGNKKDNFWEMGEVGPCGPCSEIHIDLRSDKERKEVDGKGLVNEDHPQVIEIWNLVFMQFNRKANGSLVDLPNKHVDTGMGFERLVRAIQNKTSNYDTDVFIPILNKIEEISGFKYGKEEKIDIAMRVIADHCRAIAFTIADGQLPSNNGAGYVIRRILRRAVRYGYTYLNLNEAFIYQLVEVLDQEMGAFFPELKQQRTLVEKVIKEEETTFLRTLSKGIQLLDEALAKAKEKTLDGKEAFVLYDTFGFPIDLTQLIAQEKGFEVDMEGFQKYLKIQKDTARNATAISTEDWIEILPAQETEFVGYDSLTSESKILSYRKTIQKKKEIYQIVLDKTPFYAEGGGQVGDKGMLVSDEEELPIFDTKKENNLWIHFTNKAPKNPQATFKAVVHDSKRQATACNHTATHLLHLALREVLGSHVEQKGSLVNADYLRFDFSHFSKVTEDELEQIEAKVNEMILQSLPLQEDRTATLLEAKARGAMALFGEKYGDTVRTIQFGDSIELCGGIHVKNSADIMLFKIKLETSVAAGVRRIEAISQTTAIAFLNKEKSLLDELRQSLKNPKDLLKAVVSQQTELSALRKEVEGLKKEKAQQLEQSINASVIEKDGYKFLAEVVDLDPASIKSMAFSLERKNAPFCGLFASKQGNKPSLTIVISKDLAAEKDWNAGTMVRTLGKHIQGGGGGQAHFATAGGKNPNGIEDALKAFIEIVE
ncbi:MAG: alanine--tRNA ligase [Flavobacteriales bacterium]|jgi:alanyl-tRNA synthetase|nr:alanine--tRNA ligase [Flavobacteriales bacterium]